MNDEKLEQVLQKVEPEKRSTLKKLVLGASFAVPVIASFSVKELSASAAGSFGFTTTLTVTNTITSFTFTDSFTVTSTTTSTSTITLTSTLFTTINEL